METHLEIRAIKQTDNKIIKDIIKNTLIEFNSDKPGTAFFDKSLDNLYQAYKNNKTVYYIALYKHKIVGGCGINLLESKNNKICELQKMYLIPQARGLYIGKQLMSKCLQFAKDNGYKQCYLETFPYMTSAISLYESFGFKRINKPLGNTGHTACDVRMILNL